MNDVESKDNIYSLISDTGNIDNNKKLRDCLRLMSPCIDLVENIASNISNRYLKPMQSYIKENCIKDANPIMTNLTKLIFYIGRDFVAVEYLDEILSDEQRKILDTSHILIQTFDYSDEELGVPEFICKILGLNIADYNSSITLTYESRDVENLFLPTNDAVIKLADLGYDFTADESVLGFNSGFISFDKGTFHRLINCRFHFVENENLKTRVARWIDFYPCACEEEDIDRDKYIQHFKLGYPPEFDVLWKEDVYYQLPVPKDGKYSKLPAVNRFVELFGDKDKRETDITSFLARNDNVFILLMTFAGIKLKDQVICKWQDEESRKDLKPDFFVLKADNFADIVEFKRPEFKGKAVVGGENRESFCAELNSYISQVSNYADYFDDSANRKWFEEQYGFSVYKPRKYIVIGRRTDLSTDEWRKIKSRYRDLDIYTYDDIVDTVTSLLYL